MQFYINADNKQINITKIINIYNKFKYEIQIESFKNLT
jgi:hypothetical protein